MQYRYKVKELKRTQIIDSRWRNSDKRMVMFPTCMCCPSGLGGLPT
jgi:hypothetical protein